jgi:hypothetical protein
MTLVVILTVRSEALDKFRTFEKKAASVLEQDLPETLLQTQTISHSHLATAAETAGATATGWRRSCRCQLLTSGPTSLANRRMQLST